MPAAIRLTQGAVGDITAQIAADARQSALFPNRMRTPINLQGNLGEARNIMESAIQHDGDRTPPELDTDH